MANVLSTPARRQEPIGAAAGIGQAHGVDQVFTLRDGRYLGYREFGDPAGKPVIALHGTPGSRFKYASSHGDGQQSSLRLIAVDRWGYGLSSSKADAQLTDLGHDLTQLADHLRLDRFQIIAVSGGAPFAVAAASVLRSRVCALALVSPVGAFAEPHVPVPLSPFHAFCFRVLPAIPGAIPTAFHAYRSGLALAPNLAMWVAMSRSNRADRAAIRDDETRARLIETFSSGLRPGVAGPVIDMALFGRPWGIAFDSLQMPVRIWIGLDDRNVPMSAVQALANVIPGCELIEIEGAGHLWVAKNAHVVMAWLAHNTAQD